MATRCFMILYADIFIIINAFCDWLAIWSCGRILSLRLKPVRGVASVIIFSFYSLLSVVMGWGGAAGCILNLIFLCLGCAVAYKASSVAQLVKIVVVFFICCVFIGGIAGWLYGISRTRMVIILCLTPLIYFIWMTLSRTGFKAILKKRVKVNIDGHKLSGFVDSGNLLTEPTLGIPVIVVSRKAFSWAFMYRCTQLEKSLICSFPIL